MDQYISCGVPQGSELGPLLFLIDINDICNTSEIISFCLFADDTSLLYDHNDINTGIAILNTELVKITTWLSSNKLSVNLLKTHYIIFSSGNREVSQAVPLVLNGIILQQVSSTNFLGMNIDSHLSWSNHVNNLATKILKNIGIMNRLNPFLPRNVLLTLYNSFILPYLNYSVIVWGGSISQYIKLFLLQKRAVRITSKAGYVDHTTPLFTN